MTPESRRRWRQIRDLLLPLSLWTLIVGLLFHSLWIRMQAADEYDEAALREWVDESRVFRDSLPDLVRGYLEAADPKNGEERYLAERRRQLREQLEALGNPTRMYQSQLPLFPIIYRLELDFPESLHLEPIVWESGMPRSQQAGQVRRLVHAIGGKDQGVALRIDYQLHAYNKRHRLEQAANLRLRWIGTLTLGATLLTFAWIFFQQRQLRARERQRLENEQKVAEADRHALEQQLRRQEAETRHEEAERKFLEQRLATQAAEQSTLELKSQLYASIGIMAGSYAHNIKNLLVRPNDLLQRCLEADGLSSQQTQMLGEVRQTLGTVTERLQQILQTVRRDPDHSELTRIDLNDVIRDIFATWSDLSRDKWKMTLEVAPCADPLWIRGDLSHLQQAIENLLFNARDATFEMRNMLREQARARQGNDDDKRQALIQAASWKGHTRLRARRDGTSAVLEVVDNGIGMTEEVRQRCLETHFSTKRDNALHEGNSTGMGLGLSFVDVIVKNHQGSLEIESSPGRGSTFRVSMPAEESG